jgi:ribonucleoside-diphosphate reductase beta chain
MACFATCIEGLFFFGAFAYVYFLRSKGMLDGLASGTNWVFRDESAHMAFALEVIEVARREDPTIFTPQLNDMITQMISEAVECEMSFAEDVLEFGIAGLSKKDMREYLQYIADRRLEALHIPPKYGSKNPFGFMELQDVQELTNFFERKVVAYQVGVSGDVAFDETF